MDSPLVDFYLGRKPFQTLNDDGLYIQDVLRQSDAWWEARHDYIQWMFPLPEPSKHNFHAPLLTPEDIKKFKNNVTIQYRFDDAFVRFAEFLGFQRNPAYGFNAYQFKWLGQSKPWMEGYDHNHLRITRAMASCRLVSTTPELQVEPFYDALKDLIKGEPNNFSRKTQKFWKDAARA